MTPIGLEAFQKNEATYLGEMSSDHDPPLVEVKQEGRLTRNQVRKKPRQPCKS